jgi:quercetin dioxygenase-like cupin family protein
LRAGEAPNDGELRHCHVVVPEELLGETRGMQKFSLEALGRELLGRAPSAGGGHTADTVYGGHEHVLRQTVIAMVAGSRLAEHENPGEATVHVLCGRVRLQSGDNSWDGRSGGLIVIPDARHSLEALEDSAVLLTVAKLP